MNHKDKANEIYDRFFDNTSSLLLLDWQRDDIAKQSSLMYIKGLIGEIMEIKLTLLEVEIEDYECKGCGYSNDVPIEEYDVRCIDERISYLIDVERELNKI